MERLFSVIRKFLTVCGEVEKLVPGNRIRKRIAFNVNDIRMGKVKYMKLGSSLILENLYENEQLELISYNNMKMKISKLSLQLKERAIV